MARDVASFTDSRTAAATCTPKVLSRPLRVAMISYYLPSGSKIGAGYQVDALGRELAARGHHVDIFSNCPAVPGAPYTTYEIPLRGSLRTFRFALEVRRVDMSSYDVLHAAGDDYWIWRRRGLGHVRTLYGSCFEEALRIGGIKERTRMVALGFTEVLATVVADRTVVVSPATRRWCPWVREVLPCGVDLRLFRPDEAERSSHPTVLFVGTWTGRKRGRELVERFRRDVLPAFPSAELRMVTEDAPEDVGRGVTLLGRLSPDALAAEYRRAWVFCLPSSYEGFGIPYVEAMASGLPVVATPNVGARYITREGQDGVLVDRTVIGRELAEILGDSARRARLSVAGIERAHTFSLRSVVNRYEEVYLELMRERGR